MDFEEIIKARRSVRKFQAREVENDKIQQLIATATLAPSACNRQEWRFIAIKDNSIKEKIVELGGAITIKSAPLVILALYSRQTTNLEYKDHIQSTAAAIENMLLEAQHLGLGGCWVCHLPSKRALRKLLSIPKAFEPIAAVLLGYPEIVPSPMPRKYQPSQILSFNKFDFPQTQAISKDSHLALRRALIFCYKRSPSFIKKNLLNKLIDTKFTKKFDN